MPKYAIVNADDFGQSAGVNQGIIEAHERGVVSSASLMVRWPAASEAAAYARGSATLGVGLHLDLGEWAYRDAEWVHVYQVVNETDQRAVDAEVARQIDAFHRLVGHLPTHLDTHQHVHRREPARSVVLEAGRRFQIPVRDVDVPYCGRFYGQDEFGISHPEWVGVDNLIGILSAIGPGITEIGCHPAAAADLDTMYRAERLLELATLCDPRLRSTMDQMGIDLCSFADWRSGEGVKRQA